MNVKEESEKIGLKLNIQKTKIMASGPITSWQIDGELWKLSRLSGNPANESVWVLASFREERPDDTGRLQYNLDSGVIS